MDSVARYCARVRAQVLDAIARLFAEHPELEAIREASLDYPLRAAKGLRPALCVATARALGAAGSAALPSATAIELLHNAFLIHDDVEDESLARRGEPTLQRRYGPAVAMNVGDAMLALALAPLLENTAVIGLGPALEILDRIRATVVTTAAGQASELEWIRAGRWDFGRGADYRATYEALVVAKTADYSFIAPVVIGARIAEAEPELRAALAAYARHLGVAFQITDDLLNLDATGPAYGKESAGDLWEGKRTLILLHALHAAGEGPERTAILDILSRARPDPAQLEHERTIAELHAAGHLDDHARARLLGREGGRRFKSADDVARLRRFIDAHGGREFAAAVAREHGERAHLLLAELGERLAPSQERELLAALPRYVIERAR